MDITGRQFLGDTEAGRKPAGKRLMVTGAGHLCPPLASVLLQIVMAYLVEQYVKKHEVAERVARPRDYGLRPLPGACHRYPGPLQLRDGAVAYLAWQDPRPARLFVEKNDAWHAQRAKPQPLAPPGAYGPPDQGNGAQAIGVLCAKHLEYAPDVHLSGRVLMARRGASHDETGKRQCSLVSWYCRGRDGNAGLFQTGNLAADRGEIALASRRAWQRNPARPPQAARDRVLTSGQAVPLATAQPSLCS